MNDLKSVLVLSISIALTTSVTVNADDHADNQSERPFDSLLVIGASVSADYAAPSPGRLLANQVGLNSDELTVRARNGKKSTYHLDFIENQLDDLAPDYIVALDVFFHDFKFKINISEADRERIRYVVGRFCETANKVFIGSAVNAFGLGGARKANVVLNELTNEYDNLHIIDLDTMFEEIDSREGYLYDINDTQRRVFRRDAMADAIHPNRFGTTLLANILIDQILTDHPETPEDVLDYFDLEDL